MPSSRCCRLRTPEWPQPLVATAPARHILCSHACLASSHAIPRRLLLLPKIRVDPTVKSWNVRLLGLNREGRHRDVTVAAELYRLLDAHLQAQQSTLLY